jgi:hypothetical protein
MPWWHGGGGTTWGIVPQLLTSALDGGEWSASSPCRCISGQTAPSTRWIGGWVGPRPGLDAVGKYKSFHAGNRTRAVQLVVLRYTDWAITTLTQEIPSSNATIRFILMFRNLPLDDLILHNPHPRNHPSASQMWLTHQNYLYSSHFPIRALYFSHIFLLDIITLNIRLWI